MRAAEILTALPITQLDMNLGVARLAKGHQIAFPVIATFGDGNDMMHFLNGSVPTFLKAPLTQGMRRSIAVADSFPCSAVLLVAVGRPLVTVVIIPHGFPVFLTIGTIREPTAAWVSAWTLWFSWHCLTSLPGKRKALQDRSRKAFSLSYFPDYKYIRTDRCITVAFSGLFQSPRSTPCDGADTATADHSPCPPRSAPRT